MEPHSAWRVLNIGNLAHPPIKIGEKTQLYFRVGGSTHARNEINRPMFFNVSKVGQFLDRYWITERWVVGSSPA